MSQQIVAGLFRSYVRAVYAEALEPMQYEQIEQAFYAGSKKTIDAITSVADEGEEPTDHDLAFMDELYAELLAFGEKVGQSAAAAATEAERAAHNANEPPVPQLGDAPVEEQYKAQMQAIASTLDEFLNPDWDGKDQAGRKTGFVLMVFPFGERAGRANYISNGADRQTVAMLMEEQAKRFREQAE